MIYIRVENVALEAEEEGMKKKALSQADSRGRTSSIVLEQDVRGETRPSEEN